jgi:D-3-phosphoglycerate dehydrogenase
MKVLAADPMIPEAKIDVEICPPGDETIKVAVPVKTVPFEEVISKSDFLTFHMPMPADKKPVITAKEIEKMKNGVIIVNDARGGIIDEKALYEGLTSGKIAYAGIDVFVNEPTPDPELLKLPNVSLTPHVGGQTLEAQNRIGLELADKIIEFFSKK